jgi:hypothetical protein
MRVRGCVGSVAGFARLVSATKIEARINGVRNDFGRRSLPRRRLPFTKRTRGRHTGRSRKRKSPGACERSGAPKPVLGSSHKERPERRQSTLQPQRAEHIGPIFAGVLRAARRRRSARRGSVQRNRSNKESPDGCEPRRDQGRCLGILQPRTEFLGCRLATRLMEQFFASIASARRRRAPDRSSI